MFRLNFLISFIFILFGASPRANTQDVLSQNKLVIIPGFSIAEHQAHVKLQSQESESPRTIQVLAIDRPGLKWTAKVRDGLIEINHETSASATSEKFELCEVAELKLESGKKYQVVANHNQKQLDQNKQQKAAVPRWLALVDQSDKFNSKNLLSLIQGFENAPGDSRHQSIRTNREGANFTPPTTLSQWQNRRNQLREQLLVTQGLWPMWPKTEMNPKVIGKLDRGDYTIEKVALETLPGFQLCGNLYRPKQSKGKLPAILSPHGHYQDGRMNEAVQARCVRLAKLGFIVFMYDMVGYNDSKAFKHEFSNDQLNCWGLNLVGFQTFNSIRALDWLESLPDVDATRIGCTGESGGGTQTFFLNAVDDRIAAAAPVVMISEGFQGGCVCENAAGMRLDTDNVEIGAMFAPKPMRLVGATGDWTVNTMTVVHPAISKIYGLYGRSDLITATIFNFDHNYNRVTRNAVYPFFMQWLQNRQDSPLFREPDISIESAETLLVTSEDKSLSAQMKSADVIENDLIQMQKQQVEQLLSPENSAQWQASKTLLSTAHRVRSGAVEPVASDLISRQSDTNLFSPNIQLIKSTVGRKNKGDAIPVVELRPDRYNGSSVVYVTAQGITGMIGTDGELKPIIREAIRSGSSVIAFDPLFLGLNADPKGSSTNRPSTAHFDCYNPTLGQDHAQDLATVIAFAKSRPDTQRVHLAGLDGGGKLALWVRPILSGIGRTLVNLNGESESGETPHQLKFVGWNQAGGLQGAAALSATGPLWITSFTPAELNRSQIERIYQLEGTSSQLKLTDATSKPTDAELVKWLISGE